MKPAVLDVPLADIILDCRLQLREAMTQEAIDDYADNIFDLPPGKIVREGSNQWLTAGWHRYHAHVKAGVKTMKCEVRDGTFPDALLEAAGQNDTHGVRRTAGDKRKAVAALLGETEWAERSDRMIAEACRVSHPLVAQMRKEASNTDSANAEASGGKSSTRTQRTDRSGKKQSSTKAKPRCDRCKRLWPDKDQSVEGCTACVDLRAAKPKRQKKEKPKGKAANTTAEALKDDNGVVVPVHLLEVFESAPLFSEAALQMNRAAAAFKAIEESKPFKRKIAEKFSMPLRKAEAWARKNRPAFVHQKCGADGCHGCSERGWMPKGGSGDAE